MRGEQIYIIEEPQEHPSIVVIRLEWKRDGRVWQQVSKAVHVFWDVDPATQQQSGPFMTLTTPGQMSIEEGHVYVEAIQRAIEIAEAARAQAQQ